MKDIWKGIAIFGVWMAVGIIGQCDSVSGVVTSIFAMIATVSISRRG